METASTKRIHLLAGSASRPFAERVAKELGAHLSEVRLSHFANGEISCQLDESVRNADVFVIQTHDRPVNDSIMEQAIIIDAAKRASARHITAVCPFFGYARQDRKASGREPITAKLVVDILRAAGADRLVSVDLHSGQIQGFFDGPFDHLTAMPVLINYLKENFNDKLVIVSPDAGRVKMAERYVRELGADLAIVHKRRSTEKHNSVEALDVVGDVEGRRCVLIDDMIDTAGTICAAADILKKNGASEIFVMTTHGVLSEPAAKRLQEAPIERVIATDTLPIEGDHRFAKLEQVSVAPLVAAAIRAIASGESVSELFGGSNQI